MKKFKVGRFVIQLYNTGEISVLQHPTQKHKKDFYGRYTGKLRIKEREDFLNLKECINKVEFE